ncbi:MAG: bifunctional UDP-N-acetylglucosamine pyrophosphorylase/glucosamine-1-phosphate N-acetyltransferase [Planctomycetota bacterium]|jgi:bifunctional UDP-N-acetylglucosamine pyrophosphorylase/glucosamine-1-phosphate N-acetyltransferase
MARDLDILILAAGRGTRMKSDLPKVLHSLHGQPLIHHVVEEAGQLDPREIALIVGHGRDQVKKAMQGHSVSFVVQKEQKGTGHAIKCSSRRFSGRSGHVMVLSGDVPLLRASTIKDFFQRHKRSRAAASVITATLEHPGSLGRIVRDSRGRLERIVEARDADFAELAIREINSGIYLFKNEALYDGLRRIRPNKNSGEYYLTDVIKNLVADAKKVQAISISDHTEAMGINTLTDLGLAQSALRTRIAFEHAAAGVEFVDPSSTFVSKGVTIGAGTVVWPFSVIMSGVNIGARCRVGPFAHLREGTVLHDEAEVGNFVEVKNSTLGEGTYARHLSYLGDATLGRGVNVGAGVITANFDGESKHLTQILDNAFVGSGAVLVAPVVVGKDAVVGAGAVVPANQNVESGQCVAGVPAKPLPRKKRKTRLKKK